ncbi:hypothetical protein [Lichenicoccus sp.]|uniref:hypothetical protein n=1 Tax=Lichenicoccus sp. TaxID=2781899 RepID=UPI003D0C32DA
MKRLRRATAPGGIRTQDREVASFGEAGTRNEKVWGTGVCLTEDRSALKNFDMGSIFNEAVDPRNVAIQAMESIGEGVSPDDVVVEKRLDGTGDRAYFYTIVQRKDLSPEAQVDMEMKVGRSIRDQLVAIGIEDYPYVNITLQPAR